jgi:hypothetical protein
LLHIDLGYGPRSADDSGMANQVRKVEQRRDTRQPLTGKLRLLWEDNEGKHQVCRAELENVSRSGIKIRVDVQMPPCTYVTVNDRDIGIMGRGSVRYCRFERGKYSVGLEFVGGTGWDPNAAPRPEPRWQ